MELNCLGQTPEQAVEFDRMCQDHDDTVIEMFFHDISDICDRSYQHGMTRDEIVLGLIKIAQTRPM